MLCLGSRSKVMLESQQFQFPEVEAEVIQKFYPILASIIVDDMTRESSQEPDKKLYENFGTLFLSNQTARSVSFILFF